MRYPSSSLWTLISITSSYLIGPVVAAPIITAGEGLTEATWGKVAKGTWLVEHYSPYCHHCRDFAPKWHDLVEQREVDAGKKGFHFAQVDCAANGDLCHKNGVKYYPSLFLYVDGEIYDEYPGKRTVDALSKYVDENMPGTVVWLDKDGKPERQKGVAPKLDLETDAPATPTGTVLHMEESEDEATPLFEESLKQTSTSTTEMDSSETLSLVDATATSESEAETRSEADAETDLEVEVDEEPAPIRAGADQAPPLLTQMSLKRATGAARPDGEMHALKGADVSALSRDDGPSAFVKFYAPWCSHCKALAPKWIELAKALEGSVHVYEVDCEDEANKKICREQKVRSYPTLLFYNKGASVEYNGKRDVESLKAFATKALSSTETKVIRSHLDLERAVRAEPVSIVFLHSQDAPSEDLSVGSTIARSLFGGPPFYKSSSSELFDRLDLSLGSYLLAFKDQSTTPADVFKLPAFSRSNLKRLDAAEQWLRYAKWPQLMELNGENFQDLMAQEGEPRLLGVAVLSRKGLGSNEAFEAEKAKVAQLAQTWAEARRARQLVAAADERDLAWVWVDGDRWAGWLRTMYDVKLGGKNGPELVISDVKEMKYWKTDLSGAPLSFSSASDVLQFIKRGIYEGGAHPLSSETLFDRVGTRIVRAPHDLFLFVARHPVLTFVGMLVGWGVVWWVVRWCARPGVGAVPVNAKAD